MIEKTTPFSIKFLTLLAGLLITLAPLFMNPYKATFELGAQLSGILMLVVLFWGRHYSGKVGYLYGAYLFFAVLFVGVYILPLPATISWESFPGRALYTEVAHFIASAQTDIAYPALSLIPEHSWRALFYIIPLVAMFLTVISLPKRNVKFLVGLLLVIVFFETALGVVQYASGADVFYLGNTEEHGDTASGTYRNRDHYVGLIEMSLPMAIAMLVAALTSGATRHERHRKGSMLSITLTLSLLVVLMLSAAFFSASRAGIGLVLLGLLLSAVIFAHYIGKIKSLGLMLVAGVAGLGVAFNVGIVPVLNRFASDPMEDERWRIFENTLRAIADLFPWGSGPGTFPQVYRAYQPIEQPSFVNHAHNDYLELLSDMGILGGLIIAVFLVLFFMRWAHLLLRYQQSAFRSLQIGAGIGMLLMLLHSYIDFNLHQMANALVFVFLAAIFFRQKSV